jgi:hypothetical protein
MLGLHIVVVGIIYSLILLLQLQLNCRVPLKAILLSRLSTAKVLISAPHARAQQRRTRG